MFDANKGMCLLLSSMWMVLVTSAVINVISRDRETETIMSDLDQR